MFCNYRTKVDSLPFADRKCNLGSRNHTYNYLPFVAASLTPVMGDPASNAVI